MKEDNIKRAIKASISIAMLIVILTIVVIVIIKYNVEGEKNMPFKLSKITIISTAEGLEPEENDQNIKWKLNLIQNNDIYISIAKNGEDNKESIIESVKIENININNTPQIGNIKAYMPSSVDGRIYQYKDEYIIEDKLEYIGSNKNNTKTLEIGNQGGNISMSFVNTGIGTYESNEDTEIKHDGSLIKKLGKNEKALEFSVSFDLVIKINNKNYRTNINLDLPCGNILDEGTSTKEITDTDKFVFKREN